MNHVSVPCFLQDICNPLLRTGQQLQVLMKLVKSCNFCATGGDAYASSKTIRLEEILPWFDTPIESSGNSFTFSKSRAEAAIWQRDTMYKSMLEKLHHFFSNIEVWLAISFQFQHSLHICFKNVFLNSTTMLGQLFF